MGFVVKNRMPSGYDHACLPPLLTEKEVRGEEMDKRSADDVGTLLQTDLGSFACCCDCCHTSGCNCGPPFPHAPVGNHFLTPQYLNCLCRLGRHVSADAIDAISQITSLEHEWEAGVERCLERTEQIEMH